MTRYLALLLALLATSCTKKKEATSGPGEYPYRIVATVGMIGDVTRELAGDKATAINIIGEGLDPHVYKPTKEDIDSLQSAALILYNGVHLEGKMGEVLESRNKAGTPVTAVAEGLPGFEYLKGDPHLWMDVSAWSKVAGKIQASLASFDPANKVYYGERLAGYTATLAGLHAYAQKSLASIPESQRVLVTAHDAFSYLGRAYGLEVRGIQGISTESEAGLQKINALVAYLVDKKIPAVFIESSVSDKSVKALIEGAAARGHQVVIGGELFSDAMGETGTYEGTYLGMIDHNVTTITRALGGEAPAKGFQGKLSH
ncbi:zinc ABC transporter substrate-binding protein [Akkermansiaceae bacterium]|nr:zinc ABC transporter substrate-binding protein [Akkermansiaceae bacterium]